MLKHLNIKEGDEVQIHELNGEGDIGEPLVRLTVKELSAVVGGVDFLKYRIRAAFIGGNEQTSFVVRLKSKLYIKKWYQLKHIGLPVIDSLKATKGIYQALLENGNYIAVVQPDLTADGSILLGKTYSIHLQEHQGEIRRGEFPVGPIERQFIRVFNQQKERIKQAVNAYSEISTKGEIFLPSDEYFELHFFLDGTWKISLLDFDTAVSLQDRPYETKAKMIAHNQQVAVKSLKTWEHIYKSLSNIVKQ